MTPAPSSGDWLPNIGMPASIADGWKGRLILTTRGKPASCLENALVALRHAPEWREVLHYDESKMQVMAKSVPPWETRPLPFPWRDDDDVRAAAWMQREGIMVGQDVCGQAIQTVAREHGFHPVREYLEAF